MPCVCGGVECLLCACKIIVVLLEHECGGLCVCWGGCLHVMGPSVQMAPACRRLGVFKGDYGAVFGPSTRVDVYSVFVMGVCSIFGTCGSGCPTFHGAALAAVVLGIGRL